jgi:hypothetical protein
LVPIGSNSSPPTNVSCGAPSDVRSHDALRLFQVVLFTDATAKNHAWVGRAHLVSHRPVLNTMSSTHYECDIKGCAPVAHRPVASGKNHTLDAENPMPLSAKAKVVQKAIELLAANPKVCAIRLCWSV